MAIVQQTHPGVAAGQASRQAWLIAGLCLALAAVGLCLLFGREAVGAVQVWMGSTAYNHCFLILPVAGYLAWTRREVFERLAPQPDLRLLALLVPLGLLWIVAALVSVLELQQLLVLALFQAIALAVLGWRPYRAMLLPFLYLFFLVPTGYFLVPELQNLTAWFAVAGLKLVGIPVYSDGIFIDVPAGSFVVAEACAGLRFLVASVAFGVFFAALMYRSRVRWLAFIALSVIVPIIANGIRAWGIIALAEWTNSVEAVEADHIIYGWGFFTAVTLLLIVIGMRFSDEARRPAVPRPAARLDATPARPWSIALAAVIGLALAASGPAYAQLRDWRGAAGSLAAATLPPLATPWVRLAVRPAGWKPAIQQPDREFLGVFGENGHIVAQYVALYNTAGFHNNLVRGTNEVADTRYWQVGTTGRAQARIGGGEATVATTEITGNGKRFLVWHFYIVDGKVIASPMRAKLEQLRNLFGSGDDVAAYVALLTEKTADGAEADQALQDFVTAMGPPRSYLAGVKPR
jgi:exosortase A